MNKSKIEAAKITPSSVFASMFVQQIELISLLFIAIHDFLLGARHLIIWADFKILASVFITKEFDTYVLISQDGKI